MQGCLAPSEIPGISSSDASVFGGVAEKFIYADFCTQYKCLTDDVFLDDHNPASYLYFLAKKNPHFTEEMQTDYFERAWAQKLAKVPDFLVHSTTEKVLYEIKPDSTSGLAAGRDKIGKLQAIYVYSVEPGTRAGDRRRTGGFPSSKHTLVRLMIRHQRKCQHSTHAHGSSADP